MKKNFIYLAMTLLVGVFASCSQEETTNVSGNQSNLVNISAELPTAYSKTRAVPEMDKHYLRCILEITDADGNRVHREEKLGTDASTDGKLSFTFALETEGTYNYRMWADFIDANGQQKDDITGQYTDKFFNTDDLTKITVKDPVSLFNTDACDAFSGQGSFQKEEATLGNPLNVTLVRPFAKLIVSDKSKDNFDKCTSVSVSYEIPVGFNVSTGTVSTEMTKVTLPAVAPLGTGEQDGESHDLRLFSCYVFAADDVLGEIAMTFKTTDGGRTVAIPANVPVVKNTRTQVRGYFVANAQNDGQIDTDFEGWNPDLNTEDVEPVVPTVNPEIGDFYYKDGTYSADLKKDTENPCIGVVFATTPLDGDIASNYGSEYTAIKGYVVALESTGRTQFCVKEMSGEIDFSNYSLSGTGYKNTTDFLSNERYTNNKDEYPLFCGADDDKGVHYNGYLEVIAKYPLNDGIASSGWYIPSFNQLEKMIDTYYNTTTSNKFADAVGQIENASKFVDTPNSARFLISSTITNGSIDVVRLQNNKKDEKPSPQPIFNKDKTKMGVQGQIRPILTILE